MKTIVLMGISCLMLACVYGVMIKKSDVSNLLSFNKANNSISSFGSDKDKASPAVDSAENKTSTSKNLDDSHWIYDPLFEKAAGSELITDNEVDLASPQEKGNPETIKREAPGKTTQQTPEVKQLILDLGQDSSQAVKKDLVEVI